VRALNPEELTNGTIKSRPIIFDGSSSSIILKSPSMGVDSRLWTPPITQRVGPGKRPLKATHGTVTKCVDASETRRYPLALVPG
jgi:hypothetical protein